MANIPQLQAFQNQIPFGVPNQMPSMTPQNGMGLAVPWGKATFNVTRQASSDPVQSIINNIGNPFDGMSFSAGVQPMAPQAPQPAAQPDLKQQMLSAAPPMGPENPYGAMALAQGYQPPAFGLRGKMLGYT